MNQTSHSSSLVGGMKTIGLQATSQMPIAQSPVEEKIDQLRKTLYCAEEGLSLLAEKLTPIRIQSPRETGEGKSAGYEFSPLEQQLDSLLSMAARLSTELSILRGELRI